MANYTEEQYKQDKGIIANAPEGATHVDSLGKYWVLNINKQTYFGESVDYAKGIHVFQSLNDIHQKVELYEQLQLSEDGLTVAYMNGVEDGKKEIKKLKSELQTNRDVMNFMMEQSSKRDLEQQIKGVTDLINKVKPNKNSKSISISRIEKYIEKLRK